jgi:hypothetical protein
VPAARRPQLEVALAPAQPAAARRVRQSNDPTTAPDASVASILI